MNKTNYDVLKNITIESIEKEYFSSAASEYLKGLGINTLADLFGYDISKLYAEMQKIKAYKKQNSVIGEIIGTIKLLRCKHLGEDPKIPFDEPEKIDLATDFGFSINICNSLLRKYGHNSSELFEIIKNGEYDKLSNVTGIGASRYVQLATKCSIIGGYYNKNRDQIISNRISSLSNRIDSLTEIGNLCLELKTLLQEQQELNERITTVNNRIEFLENTINEKLNTETIKKEDKKPFVILPKV